MAFPSIRSISSGRDTDNTSDPQVVLPATISAGDLLLAFVSTGVQSGLTITWDNSTAGAWTQLYQIADNSLVAACFYKWADGTEDGLTLTLATSATCRIAYYCVALQGAHATTPPEYATADHASTANETFSPPSLNPAGWDVEDTYWGAIAHSRANSVYSAWPSGYSDTGNVDTTGTGQGALAWGWKQSAAASEDPGDFTTGAASGRTSITIAIRPTAGGTTYEVSLSETIAATDAVSSLAALAAALAETQAATDAISNVATRPASISESIAAADTVSTVATLVAALAESVAATDAVSTGGGVYAVSLAETQALADTVANVATLIATLIETQVAAETLSSSATRPATVTETAALTETLSTSGAVYAVSIAESQTLLETVSSVLQAQSSLAESFAATETVSSRATLVAAIAEALQALDALSAGGITSVTLTETVALTDSLTAAGALGDAPAQRTIVLGFGSRTITVESDGRTIRVTASNRTIH